MNWIKIEEDLPINGSIVRVELSKKKTNLCIYKNDSFGLGDNDFKVLKWMYLIPPTQSDLKHQNRNPQSTLPVVDHTDAYSLGLRQHLA